MKVMLRVKDGYIVCDIKIEPWGIHDVELITIRLIPRTEVEEIILDIDKDSWLELVVNSGRAFLGNKGGRLNANERRKSRSRTSEGRGESKL